MALSGARNSCGHLLCLHIAPGVGCRLSGHAASKGALTYGFPMATAKRTRVTLWFPSPGVNENAFFENHDQGPRDLHLARLGLRIEGPQLREQLRTFRLLKEGHGQPKGRGYPLVPTARGADLG